MVEKDVSADEIFIVGSRYGDLSDVVNPIFDGGVTIGEENVKSVMGDDVVYLSPVPNKYDPHAVGVFTVSQRLLGYVWMCQSHALKRWMADNERDYVRAHLQEINTVARVLTAQPDEPLRLRFSERTDMVVDETWAANLPEVLTSITEQSLGLGMSLLRDELEEAKVWSERLQLRIDNLLRYMPTDLSGHRYKESMELYWLMRHSPLEEVRRQSDLVLSAFVCRGSAEQMGWWVDHWLPDFFRDAAEGDLLGLFEADRFTLERVEDLLLSAPHHLFHMFKVNRVRFAYHLFYSALPQTVYNRLLTLLAVREAMLQRNASKPEEPTERTTADRPFVQTQNNYYGTVYQATGNMTQGDRPRESYPTDAQLVAALKRIVGKGKAVDEYQKWLGVCCYVTARCGFPSRLQDCCERLAKLVDGEELEYEPKWGSIRSMAYDQFVKDGYEAWVKEGYKPLERERKVFCKMRDAAQALEGCLMHNS